MVTYYRDHAVLITSDLVEIRCAEPRTFRVCQLHGVHVTQHAAADLAVVRGVGAAGVGLVAATASWPFLHSPLAWVASVLLIATPGVVGSACLRHGRAVWELRAIYRNEYVELYRTTDLRTFGQVRRALVRALEANTP